MRSSRGMFLNHLALLLGGGGGYGSNKASISNAATDPLLSSPLLNFYATEAEESRLLMTYFLVL
ncbi:hypothetical protein PanWU01x14_003230 [Parasponia andersonii]|uniref:Uncharacterized protein n=1 Tax=Parasponia andersonii TaxID=3476 RepID=A0A2P5E5E5_PARAD|nr:hypothetical protein PanWU01x14_003230 [Parasponia andersonii]